MAASRNTSPRDRFEPNNENGIDSCAGNSEGCEGGGAGSSGVIDVMASFPGFMRSVVFGFSFFLSLDDL